MTKQPDGWIMNQIGETDHDKLKRLYDFVINEGGEDCLSTRMVKVENATGTIVRLGWVIITALVGGFTALVGAILSGHIK